MKTKSEIDSLPTKKAKVIRFGSYDDKSPQYWDVKCPYCDGEHRHGAGEGLRQPHCGNGNLDGYYIYVDRDYVSMLQNNKIGV